ncbi:hypothetical protein GALMADRAFT_140342 [Galerina marginata CBS 339.88]|uniref:Uncharacterized protein n=1 Tax=Galerina marginata (strain CBS 339.88) TaxID=685588 RepID=A0A067SXV6_GALM3|nr:hypothetical protein GALMADRAFT_140342 [Galerina marginata CBS 339.88]
MSESPFHKLLAKANLSVPGPARQRKSAVQSTESLPPPDIRVSRNSQQICEAASAQEPERSARASPPLEISQAVAIRSTSQPESSSIGPPTPWEAWTLDRGFLMQVYSWNAANPESTLDRILSKMSASINRHDALLELAPDGPIPLRGFLNALAHLVKLGTVIVGAKTLAPGLQFAQEVLRWVEELAAAFGDGHRGPFVAKAWGCLADIRKLIEDVCIWARQMLEKPGLLDRASVKDSVLEFREQFTQAIEHFEVLSHIHLANYDFSIGDAAI